MQGGSVVGASSSGELQLRDSFLPMLAAKEALGAKQGSRSLLDVEESSALLEGMRMEQEKMVRNFEPPNFQIINFQIITPQFVR